MSRSCPLCGAAPARRRFEKSGQTYWKCAKCALVFASATANANFHESIDNYEVAYRQYLEENAVDAVNLSEVIAWIESHIQLTKEVKLLDVGAGTGKLMRCLLRTRQCGVAAIEPAQALFESYQLARLGVRPLTLPELALEETARYDVVTILDVVEHVPEAAEFVRSVAQVTKPGGFVFITTPDTSGPLARALGRWWHHYNPYHFSLYNRRALAVAAGMAGFQVVATIHPTKRMSLDYLARYANDFLLRRKQRGLEYRQGRTAIRINLRDTLGVVWKRM